MDASFETLVNPYVRRTSSMERPASYGRSDSIYGGTKGIGLSFTMVIRMTSKGAAAN